MAQPTAGPLPWPLTREELGAGLGALDLVTFEEHFDAEEPPVRRFRAVFRG